MPTDFKLAERLAGIILHAATASEKVLVSYGELVSPDDPKRVLTVLEAIHANVFSHIPAFPDPSVSEHVL